MSRSLLLLFVIACTGRDAVPGAASRPGRADTGARPRVTQSLPPAVVSPDDFQIRYDARGRPVLPLVMVNSCEGQECQTSFAAVACASTTLRAAPSDSAAESGRVAEGDSVDVESRSLVVPVLGVVRMRKDMVLDTERDMESASHRYVPRSDTVRLRRGDTVWIVQHVELGAWVWTYAGRMQGSDQFWSLPDDSPFGIPSADSTFAVGVSQPHTQDWWFVRTRRGGKGWWHADDRIDLVDNILMHRHGESCASLRAAAAAERHRL